MRAGKRSVLAVGLVILIAGWGYGIYRWQAGSSAAGAATPAQSETPRARGVPVIAAAATRQAVPFEITAIGQVTPWQSVAPQAAHRRPDLCREFPSRRGGQGRAGAVQAR